MDRKKLKMYQRNKRELRIIERNLIMLHTHLENVPIVKGKVTASSKDFPYIEQHVAVEMLDPKEEDRIKRMIRKKEFRKHELENEQCEIEMYISNIKDSLKREVFEMIYLNGATQEQVGECLGYTQSRIAKLLKDS